jgi:hypothetical protein
MILTTRNHTSYKAVSSPLLSTLHQQLFSVLSGPSSTSTQLRSAFLPSLAFLPPSTTKEEKDDVLREMFSSPPSIALVQGVPSRTGEGEMGRDKLNLPWLIHTSLLQAVTEGNEAIKRECTLWSLAAIIYELAHFVLYRFALRDPLYPFASTEDLKGAGQRRKEDHQSHL